MYVEKLCELLGPLIETISSQASSEEGSTTIQEWSRAKSLEAQRTP